MKQFGGSGAKAAGNFVAADAVGNVYSLGTFSGTVDFNPGSGAFPMGALGPKTIYLSKLDSSGNYLWVLEIGPSDFATMTVDKHGNTYVATNTSFATYIYKIDPAGNTLWNKVFEGGNACWTQAIAVDSSNNILTSGTILGKNIDFDPDTSKYFLSGANDPGNGNAPLYTAFLCKLDSNGKFVFATLPGGTYAQVIVNSVNEIIVTGTYYSYIGYYESLYITKYGPSGSQVWSKGISNPNSHINTYSCTSDRANNICIVGNFDGTLSIDSFVVTTTYSGSSFVLKLDPNGNPNWLKKMDVILLDPRLMDESPQIIRTDTSKNIYISSSFQGFVDFDPSSQTQFLYSAQSSGFILRLDPLGNFDWVKQVGQGSSFALNSLAFDRFGNLFTTGSFAGTVDFDPDYGVSNLSVIGSYDAFVHKLSKSQLVTSIKTQSPDDKALHIFPNPTAGIAYVQSDQLLVNGVCKLLDVNGRVLLENKNLSGLRFQLDISQQASGLYILEISDPNVIHRIKLVKE